MLHRRSHGRVEPQRPARRRLWLRRLLRALSAHGLARPEAEPGLREHGQAGPARVGVLHPLDGERFADRDRSEPPRAQQLGELTDSAAKTAPCLSLTGASGGMADMHALPAAAQLRASRVFAHVPGTEFWFGELVGYITADLFFLLGMGPKMGNYWPTVSARWILLLRRWPLAPGVRRRRCSDRR